MKDANELAVERTDLAYERTALANDRTLMAWIRTAVSLVSFGFTLYKFLHEVREAAHLQTSGSVFTPRIVGMVLIGLGFLGVFFAYIQYRMDMKRLENLTKQLPRSFTPYFAIMILIFSLLLFFAALFRF